MFDISFFELLLCAIVALVVIGPERLPETVRGVSLWIGRLKRSLRETRSELEKQLGTDDIRRQLHNEEIMQNLEKVRRELGSLTSDDTQKTIQPPAEGVYSEFKELPDHAHMDEQAEQSDEKSKQHREQNAPGIEQTLAEDSLAPDTTPPSKSTS